MIRFAFVFLVAAPGALGENRDFLTDFNKPALHAVFQLRVGRSVRLSEQGLLVTFDEVTQDSRCPIDAICLW